MANGCRPNRVLRVGRGFLGRLFRLARPNRVSAARVCREENEKSLTNAFGFRRRNTSKRKKRLSTAPNRRSTDSRRVRRPPNGCNTWANTAPGYASGRTRRSSPSRSASSPSKGSSATRTRRVWPDLTLFSSSVRMADAGDSIWPYPTETPVHFAALVVAKPFVVTLESTTSKGTAVGETIRHRCPHTSVLTDRMRFRRRNMRRNRVGIPLLRSSLRLDERKCCGVRFTRPFERRIDKQSLESIYLRRLCSFIFPIRTSTRFKRNQNT